jgi:hypothetical protein
MKTGKAKQNKAIGTWRSPKTVAVAQCTAALFRLRFLFLFLFFRMVSVVGTELGQKIPSALASRMSRTQLHVAPWPRPQNNGRI